MKTPNPTSWHGLPAHAGDSTLRNAFNRRDLLDGLNRQHGLEARATSRFKGANRHAFTLIELMVATLLSAVLMGGVLSVMAGVSRDRKRLNANDGNDDSQPVFAQVERDLAASDTFASSSDGRELVLVGHGGLDRRDLTTTHRLVRVTYRVVADRLMRRQQSLDDAARPEDWQALVCANATALLVTSEAQTPGSVSPTPARVVITLVRGGAAQRWEANLR